MQIVKCLILALILQASMYHAKIVLPTSSPNKSTDVLLDAAVKIVTTCYKGRINAVGLIGKLSHTLARTLSVEHLIPTTLMDYPGKGNSGHLRRYLPPIQFHHKLDVFILTISYSEELRKLVGRTVYRSIWWNGTASFLIIDLSPRCAYCFHYLYHAWEVALLNAKLICYHPTHGAHIFAYNPYTAQAPVAWQPFFVGRQYAHSHPLTVFKQKLEGNEAICIDLDFVKTKDLGGHQIVIEGDPRSLTSALAGCNAGWVEASRTTAEFIRLIHIIVRAFNVHPVFTGVNTENLPPTSELSFIYVGVENEGVGRSYPYRWLDVVFVSKFRGNKTQLEKILGVIDNYSQIGIGVVYLVTFVFCKFFVRQSLGSTLLNLVRITCNTGFTNLPDNTSPRMYLTGLLLFVVTMQGIFQGNLAKLLTTKIPVRNVNTVKDIANWGYKIYCPNSLAHITDSTFKDVDLKEPYSRTKDSMDCLNRMLNDSLAVCMILTHGEVFDTARMHDLHMSNAHIQQMPMCLLIRYNWHLAEKLNRLLGSIREAAILEPWEAKCSSTTRDDFQFDKEVRANKDFKNIELAELAFAFKILGIGLLCATVTFIVEVVIYRYQQHNNNTIVVLNARYDHDSCARSSFGGADRTSDNTRVSVTQSLPTHQSTNELAS